MLRTWPRSRRADLKAPPDDRTAKRGARVLRRPGARRRGRCPSHLVIADRHRHQGTDDGYAGVLLDEPLPRPEFVLHDTSGTPYDFAAETAGRLTLLFFGYTSCPDYCPLQLAMLDQVLERPGAPQVTVVFVGIDPDRDTPEVVRAYLDRYNSRFVGLTGTAAQIEAAQEAAGVPPGVADMDPPGEDYVIGHGAQIIAYSPDDLAHVVYPYGVRQQDWVGDLQRLASEERWNARPSPRRGDQS